ncbi:MAG: UDP-N-acetylmuramate dehydrogenase [Eubacterium sp.]|nr:UDP-N-acetylmuramate dehydrogenase [Eubacterium sp.]
MIEWKQELLSKHTTFRIGGPADYYMVPESKEEVIQAIHFATDNQMPFYILGKGSNVLFSDEGYRGVVIEIGKGMADYSMEDGRVKVAAGLSMSTMAQKLAEAGYTGFEFASGIPGTLGGGIAMNAGAYGGEMKDCIVSATVLDDKGDVVTLAADELELGYRTSVIQKKKYIVLEAEFFFEQGDVGTIRQTMKELNGRRREKQPLEYPSAGSTFKRPEGYFAGKLIQDAGLRGYQVGDAQVSEKHCGFVVNKGNATAKDVLQLIEDVKAKVWDEFQVELEPEVRVIPEQG